MHPNVHNSSIYNSQHTDEWIKMYTYTTENQSAIINVIMPFVVAWMDLRVSY